VIGITEARLYLVSSAEMSVGSLESLVPELCAAGVDCIQLREKQMEAGDLLRVGEPIAEQCELAQVPFIVNDRPDVALALNAGVHLGQNDLPVSHARRIVGDAIIGLSTHDGEQIDAALSAPKPIDYIAVGPLYETPTKPGRPGVGLDLVRYAASAAATFPWFAIGGIANKTLEAAMGAGARRIVVVRAITESSDPPAAAHELRGMLEAVPL
jgi:thiamine-phosphate pyrophosphorylase